MRGPLPGLCPKRQRRTGRLRGAGAVQDGGPDAGLRPVHISKSLDLSVPQTHITTIYTQPISAILFADSWPAGPILAHMKHQQWRELTAEDLNLRNNRSVPSLLLSLRRPLLFIHLRLDIRRLFFCCGAMKPIYRNLY